MCSWKAKFNICDRIKTKKCSFGELLQNKVRFLFLSPINLGGLC